MISSFTDELIKLSKKTYPLSRLITGGSTGRIARHIGAKGMMSRLASGTATGNDRRALRTILMSSKRVSKEKAERLADKIMVKSKAGEFSGDLNQVAEFLSGRLEPAALSGAMGAVTGTVLGTPLSLLGAGPFTPGILGVLGAAQSAGTTALSQQISRAAGPRGLAGRIATKQKLLPAEEKLLEAISPSVVQRIKKALSRAKGKTSEISRILSGRD